MIKDKYEVTGVKFHKGHEGEPVLQCNLIHNGVKVAEFSGDEHGGEPRFFWMDRDRPALVKGIRFGGEAYEYKGTAEEAALAAYCAKLPTAKMPMSDRTFHETPDLFIEDLAEKVRIEKKIKTACKTKTVFRLVGDAYGSYRVMNMPWCEQVQSYLTMKYSAAKIERIYNIA